MTQISSPLRGTGRAGRSTPLVGRFHAPGDKSVSHRALILGALAEGVSHAEGLLESTDVLATAEAMRRLGAGIEKTSDGRWRISGTGGRFRTEAGDLDFGNSGTGVRLSMGAAAGAGAGALFIGDESLTSRPMARVTSPLSDMGAVFATNEGHLPAELAPSRLTGICYAPPIASAQVKSAILLAGLGAKGETTVEESRATRDHTERMLEIFGAEIRVERENGGLRASLSGPQRLTACDVTVPGDPSSAGFAVVAALITPGSDIRIERVMDNPARTGLFATLREMGGDIEISPGPRMAGEATINLVVRHSLLHGIDVPAERAPSMIDEYPVLSVAAALANGTTRMTGLEELRAKESDRLQGSADMLTVNGVTVRAGEDSLEVDGSGGRPIAGGGCVETRHDHRLAMSGLVLGLVSENGVEVDDVSMIATSYPDFFDHMRALGANMGIPA